MEVAPEARPPVCRVLDYSKYKYELAQKQKQARKHQQQITVREIKFRPKIAQHDYDTKKHHVERFLRHKDKVKVTIMFRGREVTHPERGTMILDRVAEELAELGVVEQRPMQEGRNMTMMLGPSKAVLAGASMPRPTAPTPGRDPEAAPSAQARLGSRGGARRGRAAASWRRLGSRGRRPRPRPHSRRRRRAGARAARTRPLGARASEASGLARSGRARALHREHRRVGVVQQLLGVGPVVRVDTRAEAGADFDRARLHADRLGEREAHALHERLHLGGGMASMLSSATNSSPP